MKKGSKGATIHPIAVSIPLVPLEAGKVEQCWGYIYIRTYLLDPRSRRDPRPGYHERDSGYMIVYLSLMARYTKLAEVVTVIAPVEDIRVVERTDTAARRERGVRPGFVPRGQGSLG